MKGRDSAPIEDAPEKGTLAQKPKRSVPKRGQKSPKEDPYTDENLLFSANSKLVEVDLVVCSAPYSLSYLDDERGH